MNELELQNVIKRRLEREGWTVRSNQRIRVAHGRSVFMDLTAFKSRRELLIEVKPNWPPYNGIGQLLFYRGAVYLEKVHPWPRDLALASWKTSPMWDRPLWLACFDARVRLILFDNSFRPFTMKHVGGGWQYARLTELAAPKRWYRRAL